MFESCVDPALLTGFDWLACYLTTGKHMAFYVSFGVVLLLLAVVVPFALFFGFSAAAAARSRFWPVSLLGKAYSSIVRGVPDIAFFLFFVIALDQAFEYARHRVLCSDWTEPVRQGSDFVVCDAAKLPLNSSPQWIHETYGFFLAVLTFAIVYGAFTAQVLYGAMRAVPHAQMETAAAYGMSNSQAFWRILVPQMWVYALPGLSNLWMILIKATPLLFLLGIEDVVYWARELGGTKAAKFSSYPHGDWRMIYFGGLLAFYLVLTWVSEKVLDRVMRRLSRGQATAAGEAQRKVAA